MDHKITALTMQKRNHQRVSVFLDGEFSFGLSRIVAAWLHVGQQVSDEKIAQLKEQDQHEVAYQQAIHYISFRPRSESEVSKHLLGQGYTEEIVQETVERLQNSGLLDDTRFANTWVENRSAFRPRSRRALGYELRQLGVSPQVVEQSLEGLDDTELAYQSGLKHARKLQSLDWPAYRQKMTAYLARRGFSYSISAPVTARLWAEHKNDTLPLMDDEADE